MPKGESKVRSGPKSAGRASDEPEKEKRSSKKARSKEKSLEGREFAVVGVGASAGGLKAIEGLVSSLPSNINFSLVVIQHLDPKHESTVPAILSRITNLPVSHASDWERIQPGRVYIKPPDRDIVIEERTLHLIEPENDGRVRLPIDRFLRSLAEDLREGAVGVILSGAGSDGSLGVKEIKGLGGLVIVQDENEAEYGGMPRSAVDTGAADLILPVGKMAEQIIKYVDHPFMFRQRMTEAEPEASTQEAQIRKILSRVRVRTGHDFSHYKRTTIHRRIARRMAVNHIDSLSEYASFINDDAEESHELFRDLLINVTNFFRDPEAFEFLEKEIVPKIVNEKRLDSDLRVWVPGCATGEEAYSLAILFLEAMERTNKRLDLKVFATDINEDAVSKAREGFFQDNIAADVSPERLRNFFVRKEDGYRIKQEVREEVVFALHDLTRDAPFLRMDLVSCRNILIYMDGELQKKIIPILHYSLNPGGALVLGTSESVGEYHDLFEPEEKKLKVYRKKKTDSYRYLNEIAALSVRDQADEERPLSTKRRGARKEAEKEQPPIPALLENIFSDLEPPGVIVDRDWEIVYFLGNTRPFLFPPSGVPTLDLIKMTHENLRFRVVHALESAKKGSAPVHLENLPFKYDDKYRSVDIKVTPVKRSPDYFLITFHQKPLESELPETEMPEGENLSREEYLQQKLNAMRQELQATVEELETTNEELKAANEELQANNEELQSTNEELESSKEELQSTNEELETTNSELYRKNQELIKSDDDAKNLFWATEIGTIFLDDRLRVKRYTPAAARIFNLIEKDLERSIEHITSNLLYDDFIEDARDVLENLNKKEKEVKAKDGRWLIMRMLPYRSSANVIEGVVVTFNDVTRLKEAELNAREARVTVESLMKSLQVPLAVLEDNFRVSSANQAFYEAFGLQESDAVGRSFLDLQTGRWRLPNLKEDLESLLKENTENRREFYYPAPDKEDGKIKMSANRVDRQDGRPLLILLTFERFPD